MSMLLRNFQISREQAREQVFPGPTRDIQNVNGYLYRMAGLHGDSKKFS